MLRAGSSSGGRGVSGPLALAALATSSSSSSSSSLLNARRRRWLNPLVSVSPPLASSVVPAATTGAFILTALSISRRHLFSSSPPTSTPFPKAEAGGPPPSQVTGEEPTAEQQQQPQKKVEEREEEEPLTAAELAAAIAEAQTIPQALPHSPPPPHHHHHLSNDPPVVSYPDPNAGHFTISSAAHSTIAVATTEPEAAMHHHRHRHPHHPHHPYRHHLPQDHSISKNHNNQLPCGDNDIDIDIDNIDSNGFFRDGDAPCDLLPEDSDLPELTVRCYFPRPVVGLGVRQFAAGRLVQRLSPSECLVQLEHVNLSPVVEVGARVHVAVGGVAAVAVTATENGGRVTGGYVARVNSDGTFGVLLDDNTFARRLRSDQVLLVEGRSNFTLEPEYVTMLEWIRDAGVKRRGDQESVCSLLFQRGWREGKLYLLEPADVHYMVYLKKSTRMVVLEKAEWQKAHHAEMRALARERVKEREWRYFVQKFSGFFSANWAGLGVLSVFLWNFKNYRKQQRAYQLKYAVSTLTNLNTNPSNQRLRSSSSSSSGSSRSHQHHLQQKQQHHRGSSGGGSSSSSSSSPGGGNGLEYRAFVSRTAEENWARGILRQLDITRPRVAVLTGMFGSGKSSLFRSAVRKENKPALFVEVRGSEDALTCVLRSMKVPNPEACGDYLDFISEAFTRATRIIGEPPVLVITLREGSELSRAYHETAVLSCDRQLCHLVMELALETMTRGNLALPRADFYNVPNFTPHQAMQYTQHALDPVGMLYFTEVIGTNSNDIDELFAAVHHRNIPITDYASNKLAKAIRQVQAAWSTTAEDYHHTGSRRHNHHNSVHSSTVRSVVAAGGGAIRNSSSSNDSDSNDGNDGNSSSGGGGSRDNNTDSSTTSSRSGGTGVGGVVNPAMKAALKKLAEADHEGGQHSGVDAAALRHPSLSDIVLYDPVLDRWLFRHKVLHTAVRCCM